MTAHHHWFRSGNHSLLAHLDLPSQSAGSGVVIVPPFGWDDICSYRPLRSLARNLASKGFPTLRFDLPGTGDSSGSALDQKLISAWIQSVQDAVAELKAVTGVQSVSILGVRLGAMLALASASAGMQADNLILWGASANGSAFLRELRAFRNLEVSEYAEGEVPPPQPIDGLEVAGFLLSRETESTLEALKLQNLASMTNRRVLLLSRDNFPHDKMLVQALEKAGCQVTLKPGTGYQNLMAAPHEPIPFSQDTESTIVDFLQAATADLTAAAPIREKFREDRLCRIDEGVIETVCSQPYKGESLFSILARPATGSRPAEWGLLFMNAGGVRHIGPNRMWVDAARRWAARGVPSMRVDFHRVGESDGEQQASIASLHADDLVEQLSVVMDSMNSQLNCQRFIAVGLCSGAFAAFQSLIRNPQIRGAVLLNPRLFFWDPEIEPRRLAKRVGTGLGDASYWRRLVRGEIQPERIKEVARVALTRLLHSGPANGRQQQIQAQAMARAWDQVKRFQTRVTLVFADGEPLIQEMVDEKQMPPPNNSRIQCVRVGKTGHTFRALWAQQLVQDLIDREINATMQNEANVELLSKSPEGVSLLA